MTHPMPGRSGYFMDISDNNPLPDLDAYKAAGHHYLAVKISEGTGYYWPDAGGIIDAWHARGGSIIGYHWLRPDSGTPAQQVGFYFSHFGPHFRPGDLTMNDWERSTVYRTGRPALEPPPTEWAAQAAQFNDACQRTYNAHVVYTGNWYLDEGHPLVVEAQRWPVILSDYTGGDGPPNNRLGLKIWARQFTDRATVPGMSRTVDYNHIINPGLIAPQEVDMTPEDTEKMIWQCAEALAYGTDVGPFTRKKYPGIVLGAGRGYLHRLDNLHATVTALKSAKKG